MILRKPRDSLARIPALTGIDSGRTRSGSLDLDRTGGIRSGRWERTAAAGSAGVGHHVRRRSAGVPRTRGSRGLGLEGRGAGASGRRCEADGVVRVAAHRPVATGDGAAQRLTPASNSQGVGAR